MADRLEVPIALLWEPLITTSDKLVWMVIRLDRLDNSILSKDLCSPSRLDDRTGLSRSLIYDSLRRLEASGWFRRQNGAGLPEAIINYNKVHQTDGWVTIPAELLAGNLRPREVVMYGFLLNKNHRHWKEGFTYRSLAAYMGRCSKTVRRAIQNLVQNSWLNTRQDRNSQKAPYKYNLDTPIKKYCREQIELIRNRMGWEKNKGEAIAYAMAKLVLEPSECLANSRPDWLTNPKTNEPLELDLWFPAYKLGVEYNGPQHYQPTPFATMEDVIKQQERDALKAELMQKMGFKLVVLTAADLSIKAVIQKLQGLAPLRRNLRWYQLLIKYLNKVGMGYQQNAGNPVYQT